MSWYRNEISDKDSARYATTTAVWISYLIAAANGVMSMVGLVYHKPIVGLSGSVWGACLYTVVAWQIGRLSRFWAVVGFSLYLLGGLIFFGTHSFAVSGLGPGIVALVFLTVYVNALRGTFAYHKYVKLQAARPAE
jgi:hypothetical protein